MLGAIACGLHLPCLWSFAWQMQKTLSWSKPGDISELTNWQAVKHAASRTVLKQCVGRYVFDSLFLFCKPSGHKHRCNLRYTTL